MSDLPKFTAAPSKIQHIIRMFNTNIDGTKPVALALTGIKGIGRRYADALLKRSNIGLAKRAGELSDEELERINEIIQNPTGKIPTYMNNHQFDANDGTTTQLVANNLDANYRLLLERGKKIRNVKVMRILKGLKVRGQRTQSNGRHGGAMGVSRKK